MSDSNRPNTDKKIPRPPKRPMMQWYIVIGLLGFIALFFFFNNGSGTVNIRYSEFEDMVLSKDVANITIEADQKTSNVFITLKEDALQNAKYDEYRQQWESYNVFGRNTGPHFYLVIASTEKFIEQLETLNAELPEADQVSYKVSEAQDYGNWVVNIIWIGLLIGFMMFLMRRMSGGGGPGGQIFNIGKSKAALFDAENKIKITFENVAGLDEAKEEVEEIVEFLKTPGKFTKLGGKIPKGALLVGPPGTGKTLLAKAVAGEAGVPFFSLSGSDFVEMFVGVGAARVRDLFKQAKEKAPCIIFIDEIDAIGRSRGRGNMPGGNDERENTLNSLLVEMDGFATDLGVIILGATNRPDVLDSALLRPGRFDRQISIDKPDIVGREAIFGVHLEPIKTAEDVDSKKLAAQTPGFAGAEIANVCNEAALIAARRSKEAVDMQDFQDAIDRVIGGLEKKNKLISPEEKKIVAYHEAGHAVVGWFLEHADPLVKVSIVPRGVAALGYAQYLPKEQFLYQTDQLMDQMAMALGGRAAEELVFDKISTGALSDLERITKTAYNMVSMYGMTPRLANISFYDPQQSEYNFSKPYSEATAQKIDEEARHLIDKAYEQAKAVLKERHKELETLAKELLEKEILFQSDLERLIGKRPFDTLTSYQAFTDKVNGKKESDSSPQESDTADVSEDKGANTEGN